MRRLFCIVTLAVSLGARAQLFDAAFSNSWALQSYYNPAAAGLDSKLNVQGDISMQMVGFEDAPKTMLLSADMPLFFLSPKHGAGLVFVNDEIGAFSNKKLQLEYAFHQKLFGGRMSIGVRPTLLMVGITSAKIDLDKSGDPAFPTSDVKGNAFDLDLGLRFSYKKLWYAGASVTHLLSPTVSLGDDKRYQVVVDPTVCMQGGYTYTFRYPRYKLDTNAMYITDLQNWRCDISTRLLYDGDKHKLYGGLLYCPTISVGVLLGFDFHGIGIGYSYEAYTGGIGALNGTHEIILSYQHELDLNKKGKNLHKAVRFL